MKTAMKYAGIIGLTVLAVLILFATACRIQSEYLQLRSAEQMSCAPHQIIIKNRSSSEGIRDEITWRAVCFSKSFDCTLRPMKNGNRRVVCTSMPVSGNHISKRSPAQQGVRPSAGITPQEGYRVLKGAEPEMQLCTKGIKVKVSVKLQVNGDGSVNYLGTTPTTPVESSACLRRLVSTIRFRSTGADPFTTEFSLGPSAAWLGQPPTSDFETPRIEPSE